MFRIERAQSGDVEAAVAALGDAFARDPLMLYLFHENPAGIRAGAMGFFSILLRVRVALDMPALVLRHGDTVLGAAMGYDTSRPTWPEALAEEFRQYQANVPGFADRLAAYGEICDAHEPAGAHFYLGVIGVHPSLQGKGAGKALLEAFCAGSHADPASGGVYLDTTSTSSLDFYYRNGFELRGEGRLDATTPVWCVYRRT